MSSSDAYWLTQGDNLEPSKPQRASMAGPNDLFFGEGGIVIVLNQTKTKPVFGLAGKNSILRKYQLSVLRMKVRPSGSAV